MGRGVWKVPAGVTITSDLLKTLRSSTSLPGAVERIENLVILLASYPPGARIDLVPQELVAKLGAESVAQASWVVKQATALNLVEGWPSSPIDSSWELRQASMTVLGWQRHTEMVRSGSGSKHAFMAMSFRHADVGDVYRNHMRPAVAETGFDLRTTNEDHQTAGLIDNRMRVEIRTSRFVLCDLTHANLGAYWEAGFAEGLGRPVIYVCRADVLEEKLNPCYPHFDAAHQLILPWNLKELAPFLSKLKSAIRATLPAEATLEDVPVPSK